MKKNLCIFAFVFALFALQAHAALEEMAFADRIVCEVQDADGESLRRLNWQQGATPLVDLYVLRRGRPIATDTTVTARLVFGASATAAVYAVSTNYAVTNNSYLCQVSTVGTNSAAATNGLWWYTVYFDRSGKTFWTGNGELVIEQTTSTADGTVWQEITTSAEVSAHNTNTVAHADIRAGVTSLQASTSNWNTAYAHTTESSNTVHGGFIKTAYDWATNAYAYAGRAWDQATNALAVAQIVHAWGNHALAGYVTGTVVRAEVDHVWGAVSNTVTVNAAAGQAHAATPHGMTQYGGFYAGTNTTATDGGAVGNNASTTGGGAIGFTTKTSDGFAGGMGALATVDGTQVSEGINAIQLGTGGNTNPLSLQVYSFTMMLPDGTIPLARMAGVTNGAALGATALQPASTNGWTVTSHDGLVPTSRTITVNGQVGTLDANVTLTLTEAGSAITNMLFWAGPAATQSATNANTVYFRW